MSDADDLLGKADALLGRYRAASANAPTVDIPVLTDVVDLAPSLTESGLPHSGEHKRAETAARTEESPGSPMIAPANAETGYAPRDSAEVAADRAENVRHGVMQALDRFLGEEFDMRLRAGLDLAVHRLAFELLAQVRDELDSLVRDAVSRALAEKGAGHDSESPGPESPGNPL